MPKQKQHAIEYANVAITAYTEAKESSGQSLTENMVDLLTDLWHFANAKSVDFTQCVFSSGTHYKAETGCDDYDSLTDRSTYLVEMRLSSDESTHSYWKSRAETIHAIASEIEQVKNGTWTIDAATRYQLADEMEAALRDASPVKESSVYSDLVGTALGEVNWVSIADIFIDGLEG